MQKPRPCTFFSFYSCDCYVELSLALPLTVPSAIQISTKHASVGMCCYNYNLHHRADHRGHSAKQSRGRAIVPHPGLAPGQASGSTDISGTYRVYFPLIKQMSIILNAPNFSEPNPSPSNIIVEGHQEFVNRTI